MPRANRHYLSGYVWHITHRCHRDDGMSYGDYPSTSLRAGSKQLTALTLAETLTSAITGTVFSSPNGYYTFECVPDGSYTITPSSSLLSFSPGGRGVTVTGGTDAPGQDFQASFVP